MRYDARDGYVWDWVNLEEHRWYDEEKKEWIQEHLYAKTIYLGKFDRIENYIEVPDL